MALRRNCKHQGFAYARDGHKNIRIICDIDGDDVSPGQKAVARVGLLIQVQTRKTAGTEANELF